MSKESVISEEFKKVIKDFVRDIKKTFPEYDPLIRKWWKDESSFEHIENAEERKLAHETSEERSIKFLFGYCQKKIPPRFFDILYQNEDMFKDDSTVDTEFLPHISFKSLWGFEITQKTRDIIWKYLQLILFSIVGTLDNKDMFGDSAKLFEHINEAEFKTKLEETLLKMQGLFDMSEGGTTKDDTTNDGTTEDSSNINMDDFPNIPNAQEIHDHITGMLDGKLGKLAKEIAEETASDLNMDMDNVTDMKGVFNNLVKNPTKLMGLVKNVGDKLENKIKSGELKESELISEATDIMNKMKNMPGMGDIQSMLNKMGMGGMGGGKGGKVNTGAMEAQLERNLKAAKTKERIKAKAEMNRVMREKQAQQNADNVQNQPQQSAMQDEKLFSLFANGDKAERTPRGTKQPQQPSGGKKKKSKK